MVRTPALYPRRGRRRLKPLRSSFQPVNHRSRSHRHMSFSAQVDCLRSARARAVLTTGRMSLRDRGRRFVHAFERQYACRRLEHRPIAGGANESEASEPSSLLPFWSASVLHYPMTGSENAATVAENTDP
jgi:hypothetical protein